MTIENRPWGSYRILAESKEYKVKIITVSPNKRLSLQRHQLRREHWVVTAGEGTFTFGTDLLDLQTRVVCVDDTIDIPRTMIHRIEAGPTGISFIEVQTGTYFGEDDIERFEDDFGRISKPTPDGGSGPH